MKTEKPSVLDRLTFVVAVVATAGFAVAAIGLFINAYRMSVANAAAPLEAESMQAYEAAQAKLLTDKGPADDRALGGESGRNERANKLGATRTSIRDAMAQVTKSIQKGDWTPVRLNEAQVAILDRLDMGGVTPEAILAAVQAPNELSAGQATFTANCAACHGAAGNGLVGPNLTDRYWIHGQGPPRCTRSSRRAWPPKACPRGPISAKRR